MQNDPRHPEISPPGEEKAEDCLFECLQDYGVKMPQHETEGVEMAAHATRKLKMKAVM